MIKSSGEDLVYFFRQMLSELIRETTHQELIAKKAIHPVHLLVFDEDLLGEHCEDLLEAIETLFKWA